MLQNTKFFSRRAVEYAIQHDSIACLILLHNYVQTHGLQANRRNADISLHKVSQNNAQHQLQISKLNTNLDD